MKFKLITLKSLVFSSSPLRCSRFGFTLSEYQMQKLIKRIQLFGRFEKDSKGLREVGTDILMDTNRKKETMRDEMRRRGEETKRKG